MAVMFESRVYVQRRRDLAAAMGEGRVLIQGAPLVPRNYPDNVYPFRQSSHMLYYAGIARPDLWLLLDAARGRSTLYSPPWTVDDVVWCGEHPTPGELAERSGIDRVAAPEQLRADLDRAGEATVHYLPPYRASMAAALGNVLGCPTSDVARGVSPDLLVAVTEQRLVKTVEEVAQVEEALGVTGAMYDAAMRAARPGLLEADIAGIIQGVALRADRQQTFLPITTVRGEVLHNESRGNRLAGGQLLLIDSGVESPEYYASDITRTFPVSGRFDGRQRDVYEVVLGAQKAAIEATRPGIRFSEVHRIACRATAAGLRGIGLMKGDVDEAVAAGAHALFFPHGLGHALGLDVHDMEDLGDVVGYGAGVSRNPQFGLAALRFARTLQPGYLVTIEPGIYFIPKLVEQWAGAGTASEFIDYGALEAFMDFGGVRIEDDVLVTSGGCRVLGRPIPREIGELEAIVGG